MLVIFIGERRIDGGGNPTAVGKDYIWKVGQPEPPTNKHLLGADCVLVSASETELVYVLNRFKNLPQVANQPPGFSQTWTGDLARFILNNLVD